MKVRVQYYAVFREERGLGSEDLETRAVTISELYEELRAEHGFRLPVSFVRAAVNAEFVPMDARLKDGDAVAFIPPVAGG